MPSSSPGSSLQARAVCEKWGLRSTVIGSVTDTGRFVVREGDAVVADMPAATLAHDAPIYDPAMERPAYLDEVQAFDPLAELDLPGEGADFGETLLGLLASPNICSRAWIWEQYDHQVMLNTVVLPGSDAAVLRIGDTGRGEMTDRAIAVSSDCNGRYCYLDPYVGAQIALAEAARNVTCAGGDPAAITDCLNFGSPEKPEVFWTFHEADPRHGRCLQGVRRSGHLGQRELLQRELRPAHLPHADRRPGRAASTTSTTTARSTSKTRATSSSSWARARPSSAVAST